MPDEQPIIVIKKKGGHAGHHGGAWKVAYADFVTAMMSLFIVLWLMSSTSKQTQEEIAGYFNDPKGTASKKGSEGKPIPKEVKETKEAKESKPKPDMVALKAQLTKAIEAVNELNKIKKQIEISLQEEGLRIELIEDQKGTFFETGSTQPTPALMEILKLLSTQLKGLPNSISIEGHTDAQPYTAGSSYGNWELSTDRANVARREMQKDGIRPDQISQVRGFADQRLHIVDKPFDPSNRRVSLVVQNLPGPSQGPGQGRHGLEDVSPDKLGEKLASTQAKPHLEEVAAAGSAAPLSPGTKAVLADAESKAATLDHQAASAEGKVTEANVAEAGTKGKPETGEASKTSPAAATGKPATTAKPSLLDRAKGLFGKH